MPQSWQNALDGADYSALAKYSSFFDITALLKDLSSFALKVRILAWCTTSEPPVVLLIFKRATPCRHSPLTGKSLAPEPFGYLQVFPAS